VFLQQRRVLVEHLLILCRQFLAIEREKDGLERRVAVQVVERRRRNPVLRDRFGWHHRRFADRFRRRRRPLLGGGGWRGGAMRPNDRRLFFPAADRDQQQQNGGELQSRSHRVCAHRDQSGC